MDDGNCVKPKQKVRNIYYSKYNQTYVNISYVIYRDYIKDMRIHQTYSVRKRKDTGFVYLKGSPYCDSGGSSNLRSCLHDAMINSEQILGGEVRGLKTNCIYSVRLEWRRTQIRNK